MKRATSLTLVLIALTAGVAVAAEGTEEFATRLMKTSFASCPAPIETQVPSTYPLDSN